MIKQTGEGRKVPIKVGAKREGGGSTRMDGICVG